MYKRVLGGIFLSIHCFACAVQNIPVTDTQLRTTSLQEADKASLQSKYEDFSFDNVDRSALSSFIQDDALLLPSENTAVLSSAVQPKFTLALFLQSLKKYRLNAYWITKDFMELSIDEFEKAWKEIVTILSHPDRRWFYFCDKKEDFNEDEYWAKFLRECVLYDAWLTKTYVDVVTGELLYKEEADTMPERVMTLNDYWALFADKSEMAQKSHPLTQFYAFFIDCLSYFFCRAVDEAYYALSDTSDYNPSVLAAKLCLERINRYLAKIKVDQLYTSYQLTVKKYQEVIDLLEQERLKQLLGELYV